MSRVQGVGEEHTRVLLGCPDLRGTVQILLSAPQSAALGSWLIPHMQNSRDQIHLSSPEVQLQLLEVRH